MKKTNIIYSFAIIILIISNILIITIYNQRFSESKLYYAGYVENNNIVVGKTTSVTCVKQELQYNNCFLLIPKNEIVDIIYNGKNGWYYGNWKYGKLSVWGWIEAKTVATKNK